MILEATETVRGALFISSQSETGMSNAVVYSGLLKFQAVAEPQNSGISAKSREIDQKHAKYREIRLKFYQIHVGTTFLKLILAIGAVSLP